MKIRCILIDFSDRQYFPLNKEIANKLFLAEGTVKNYVTSILQKIGARDRTQAAIRARELGLLDTNNPI